MNWIKNKIAGVLISVANVEKNSFSQEKNLLSDDINKHSEKETGTLMNSLKNNIMTQEVMDLRWRTYKILRETEGLTAEIVGYEKDGTPIVETRKTNKDKSILKIKVDDADDINLYPLEMVLDNLEIVIDSTEHMSSKYLDIYDKPKINLNEKGEVESASHGEINVNEFLAINKTEKLITINRDFFPRFNIEKYTKKLNIRK